MSRLFVSVAVAALALVACGGSDPCHPETPAAHCYDAGTNEKGERLVACEQALYAVPADCDREQVR